MDNKRGLSQIVTTIILVLLILVAIAGIWAVVNSFLIKGSERINLDQFTINLKMKSASINYTTGIAEVSVFRDSGAGDLESIKFIVEDKKNSYVFERDASTLFELGTRTYTLDLTEADYLALREIYKISIAPVYVVGEGSSQLGSVSDTVGGLNTGVNLTDVSTGGNDTSGGTVCNRDSDCGVDVWVEDTEVCDSETIVTKYLKSFYCEEGFCGSDVNSEIFEMCQDGEFCYDGQCIEEEIPCTAETVGNDCGVSDWTGQPGCSADERSVVQDWQEFSCVDSSCVSTTEERVVEDCAAEEICNNGECFIPLECTTHDDCDPGEVCEEGECVLENYVATGTLRSVWPYGVGEYADSEDLPLNKTGTYKGYQMIFPGGSQEGCLEIDDYVAPDFEEGIPYVRFATSPTNVSDGDSYEIWETDYICSTL